MAKIDVMLYNKDKTESVRASKIRSFGIYPEPTVPKSLDDPESGRDRHKLLGWYNQNEYFYFGWWETKEQAQDYLECIHAQIEGR